MVRRLTNKSDAPARKARPMSSLPVPKALVPANAPSGHAMNRNRYMPGLQFRANGWTEDRTQRFLDVLGHTGCVSDAARVASVSTGSCYRQKKRFPLFSAAWDDAVERAGKGLVAIAYKRAVETRETLIIRNGEEYERRIQPPSDAMLGLLIKRGDLAGGGAGAIGGEDAITLDEWQRHVRFNERGRKITIEDPAEGARKFIAKMDEIRHRLKTYAAQGGACPTCKQTLPEGWPNQSMAELVASGLVHPDELYD